MFWATAAAYAKTLRDLRLKKEKHTAVMWQVKSDVAALESS